MRRKTRMAGATRGRPLRGMLVIGVAVLLGGIAIAAEDAKIMIDNFKFASEPMTVAAGSTITWVNRDDIPHSVVLPTLGVHSPPMNKAQLFTSRFDKPGTYDYIPASPAKRSVATDCLTM